jgi:3'(2'), 5'-bisphosphate nucleotidase
MPPITYERERSIAQLAVHRAVIATRMVQAAIDKGTQDGTPVSLANFAAQALIISTLQHVFRQDLILGEESANALRSEQDAECLRRKVWELVEFRCLDNPASEELLGSTPDGVEQLLELIDLAGNTAGCGDGVYGPSTRSTELQRSCKGHIMPSAWRFLSTEKT